MGKGRTKRQRRRRRQRKNEEFIANTSAAEKAAAPAPRNCTCRTCRYWSANASLNYPPEIDNGRRRLASVGYCRRKYPSAGSIDHPLVSTDTEQERPALSKNHRCDHYLVGFCENTGNSWREPGWKALVPWPDQRDQRKPLEPPNADSVKKFQKKY